MSASIRNWLNFTATPPVVETYPTVKHEMEEIINDH
jgi:hypothetical protein